jgi:hypothetical protein
MQVGAWELPLHHPDPPPTARDDCNRAADHVRAAIAANDCNASPPALDVKEEEWHYDYIALVDGANSKVWQEKGSLWKPVGQGSSILPLSARDPDTGRIVHAKAAAHLDHGQPPRVRHIEFTAPLVEKSRRLTVYTCTRK